MSTHTLAPLALLLALASVPLACVGRPSMQPRMDRKGELLEPNSPTIENPPTLTETPARTNPTAENPEPRVSHPSASPLESTTGTLVATGGTPPESIDPISSLEEESGSGVNNGIIPTPVSYLTCKGTETGLTIRSTPALTSFVGTLDLGGEYQALSCKEGPELEPWTCKHLDLPLLVRVVKNEDGSLKGMVLENVTDGVEALVSEMVCVKPKK